MDQQMAFSEAVAGCAAYIKEHKESFVPPPPESHVGEERAEHLRKIDLAADRMARTTSYEEFWAELKEMDRLGMSLQERDIKLVALAHIKALLRPDLPLKRAETA
jgi:hypothetical protein